MNAEPSDLMLVHRETNHVRHVIEGVELWLNFAKACADVIDRDAIDGRSSTYVPALDAALCDIVRRLGELRERLGKL